MTTAATHQKEKPLRGRKKSTLEVESAELSRFEPVVQDSFSLVMAAREGVLAKVAFEVADRLLLHLSQMANILHITTKTLQSYKQSKKKLSTANSEQTLKLLALQMKGEEVFGATDAFRRWLEKPAYGLDGQVPLDLLETSGGIDLVMEEVERIAYGDLA
jgi:putative toxin-antitoxin system antitoxin component (TIGR02293 family)